MRAIIAVPRHLSLFPFPFHLPHFFITSFDLNHSPVLCSQFKTRSYPSARLLILGATLSVATAPCLVITGSKQEPADAVKTQLTLSGELFFFILKVHKHNWKNIVLVLHWHGLEEKYHHAGSWLKWQQRDLLIFFNDIYQFFKPCVQKQNNRLRGTPK